LLVYGFYVFNMGAPAQWGGILVLLSVLSYLVNLGLSLSGGKSENVHAVFVFTAVTWLFLTASLGLAMVYNFTMQVLPRDSLHYLSLHVHAGVVGWFLLLVIGVASRLIPMFLISKYNNPRLLWWIYALLNLALLYYTFRYYLSSSPALSYLPIVALLTAIILFVYYSFQAYKQRLRKQVDEQVKLSLLSVVMILLPVLLLIVLILVLTQVSEQNSSLILAYGFVIFFGWLTAIILGMTFKTLPFIVWNKVYHQRAASGKSPNPKDLFSDRVFRVMALCYLAGFVTFAAGVLSGLQNFLKSGAVLLLLSAIFYNWNILKIINHQPASK
jgi:hypothetical protein